MSTTPKTIVRVSKRENPYVTLDKFFLSDDRLSWKAKGLLSYLLSKPDNWEIYVSDLLKRATDGRDSIYAGLKELEKAGYLRRNRKHNENGRFDGYEYVIYERPQEEPLTADAKDRLDPEKPKTGLPYTGNPDTVKPYPEKPYTDYPYTEKPYTENPTLLNNDINNNDSTKERQQQKDLGTLDPDPIQSDNQQHGEGQTTNNVVVPHGHDEIIKNLLEAFWKISQKRKSDYQFFKKLLTSYSEEEILAEIRKIDQTYPDKSMIKEPKALLIAALRTRFDEPVNPTADISKQADRLRKAIGELSRRRFGLSFDAKIQALAEMGHRFSPEAIEVVKAEHLAREDKYKDVYR